MKKVLLFTIYSLFAGSLLGQDTSTQTSTREKMVCERMDLEIQSTTYNDALRCETKDAICYMIEGFSMSCFPKDKKISK
ncbi:hypothetical protein EHO58_06575 [Leptospira selangorensis]|uniref:hypothetical protein n=1 Tax=Leptospira selangorensis TaxID=2484982 RepID=UPI001082DD92|nr:hypothetical protein [Leptospira selangorensis]TGK08549.1 hypothetical protein EHO58_06575 [Leptospira selangorensis]